MRQATFIRFCVELERRGSQEDEKKFRSEAIRPERVDRTSVCEILHRDYPIDRRSESRMDRASSKYLKTKSTDCVDGQVPQVANGVCCRMYRSGAIVSLTFPHREKLDPKQTRFAARERVGLVDWLVAWLVGCQPTNRQRSGRATWRGRRTALIFGLIRSDSGCP